MSEAKLSPVTEGQAAIVREQLMQILQSQSFAGSKRCQEFLEFVVNHALRGDAETLKERTIGAKLFGRPIDYETSSDPIVRVKANDVRRRLTRYNLEAGARVPVRITMPAGSYLPDFVWAADPSDPALITSNAVASPVAQSASTLPEQPRPARNRLYWTVSIGAILICAVAGFILLRTASPSALDSFWGPALQSDGPVLVCFGRTESIWLSERLQSEIEKNPQSVAVRPGDLIHSYDYMVSAGNLRGALAVTRLLEHYKKSSSIAWPSEVQASDLRHRTIVLLGAFNNPWTMDLTKDARFVFLHERRDGQLLWVIRDSKNKDRKWELSETYPQPITRDYAIITRVFEQSRQVVISAAGMNHFGTQVAAEFLCDPEFWRELAGKAPKDWERRNLQVLLEMEISGNKPVHPRVIGTEFW
jgi:hypothetical protein